MCEVAMFSARPEATWIVLFVFLLYYFDKYAAFPTCSWTHISPGCVRGHNLKRFRKISLDVCKQHCASNPKCAAIEYGVPHNGKKTIYKTGDCQLNSGKSSKGCDGRNYNLDLYVKGECQVTKPVNKKSFKRPPIRPFEGDEDFSKITDPPPTNTPHTEGVDDRTQIPIVSKEWDKDCKILRSFTGFLNHPSYPWGYENNVDTCWLIVAPQKYQLNITFQYFKLESSENCENDFVTVTDGWSRHDPVLKKLCGELDYKAHVTSSRSKVLVRFKTNKDIMNYGFIASYQRVTKAECREAYGASGFISHPGYPWGYSNNMDTCWRIIMPKGYRIHITFRFFQLEVSQNCDNDYVMVHDGGSMTDRILKKMCGVLCHHESIVSTSNEMLVHFKTSRTITSYGFIALYLRIGKN